MNLEGKKILVTGASGLIGSNLVRHLNKIEGTTVISTKNQSELREKSIVAEGDLLNPDFCNQITKDIDVVFHCAAKSYGAMIMETDPMALVRDNIVMNINVLEACHKNEVDKFVWLASTTGYPNTTDAVTEDRMFEGEPFDKYYAVGWVKRYTEVLCKLFSEKLSRNLPCVVLRPTNIYGPNDKIDFKKSHVFSALVRKVVEKHNPVEIWGDGLDERDLLYVDDMVDAMILAAEKVDKFEQINVGYGECYTILDIFEKIKKSAGYDLPHKLIPTGPRMIPIRRVNIEKAKQLLNWSPKVNIDQGIKNTIDWMKLELSK